MNGLKIKEAHKSVRQAPRWVAPQGRYGRGYMSERQSTYNSKPRLYVWVDGENILENFANRFDRPQKLYRSMLPEIFKALDLEPVKASWSQKAGCSCGCSPGFILDINQDYGYSGAGQERVDYHVTLEASEEAKVAEDANQDRRAGRLGALLDDPTMPFGKNAPAPSSKTGRSGSGNLRNFGAMSDEKFRGVYAAIVKENNDEEAIGAVCVEAARRGMIGRELIA